MMNCLDNTIGIHRLCSPVVPMSGLYVQDLPGITLSVANAAVDNETMSGVKLIQEKIEFAQNAILAAIRTQLSGRVKIDSIISNDTLGYDRDNLRVVAAEVDKYKGIKIKINQYPYLEFFINRIGLKLSQNVDAQIKVFDLMSDIELDSFDISTIAKTRVYAQVQKGYKTYKQRLALFIGIDSGLADAYETNITKSGCYTCNGSYSNRYANVTGASIAQTEQKIENNIRANNGTNGLSVDYSLNCSVEPFICNMGNQLAWPLLHKVGAELMRELVVSRRLNSVVNIDKGTNQSLLESFEAEYMASMGAILNNIKAPKDICFSCDSRMKKATAIP